MQITYEDGGPSYFVNDYFPPHLHYQTAATLADENYDYLTERSTESKGLQELETESKAVELLSQGGAADDVGELNLR